MSASTYVGNSWSCSRPNSTAALASRPQSRFSSAWKTAGKMREPPDAPVAAKKSPCASSMIVGAVEESGRLPGCG